MGGVDGGWGSTRVGEYISIVSSIATDACCYAARPMLPRFRLVASSSRSFPPFRLLSLSLAPSRFIFPPLPPSFGFFLFGKRFSPFLPRDRTLTLRRRSRGVENTGSTTRRDETDVSRSFLSIARTVTFRLRDTPPFSSRPPPPHSIESFSNQFELAIPPFLPPRQEQIPRYSPNREHLAIKLSIIRDLRCLLFSIVRVRVRPLDDLGSRIPKCLAVSLAIEERERKRERESEWVLEGGDRRPFGFARGVGGLVLAGY